MLSILILFSVIIFRASHIHSQCDTNLCEPISFETNSHMEEYTFMNLTSERQIRRIAQLLPPENSTISLQGRAGSVGIIGGSVSCAGSPYFAGIAAHYSGADSVYIFTVEDAVIPIKSYSKELIVLPYLDSENAKDLIISKLPLINSLIIGPGLKFDETINDLILSVIIYLKENRKIPLIIDNDAIIILIRNSSLMLTYDAPIYITPNEKELQQLLEAQAENNYEVYKYEEFLRNVALNINKNAVLIMKGMYDRIINSQSFTYPCCVLGSWRRCKGQGSILTGLLGLFSHWAELYKKKSNLPKVHTEIIASFAACSITRLSCRNAFSKKNRSMLTSDMVHYIQAANQQFFHNKS